MTPSEVCAALSVICQVPATIESTIGLLKRRKPDTAGASEELMKLVELIRKFCQAHRWLGEAKDLHDYLSNLQISLRKPIEESRRFLEERGKIEGFGMREISSIWRAVAGHHFAQLFAFAEHITDIEKTPLTISNDGQFEAGPRWARNLLAARDAINRAFKRHAEGKATPKDYRVLAEQFDGIDATLASEMGRVNQMIRRVAAELQSSLSQVLGRIESVTL